VGNSSVKLRVPTRFCSLYIISLLVLIWASVLVAKWQSCFCWVTIFCPTVRTTIIGEATISLSCQEFGFVNLQELSSEGDSFTPSDVERALWSFAVGQSSGPQADQDPKTKPSRSSKRKRKNWHSKQTNKWNCKQYLFFLQSASFIPSLCWGFVLQYWTVQITNRYQVFWFHVMAKLKFPVFC